MVKTDTNNHNSGMAKNILPYNFNICYRETYWKTWNWYAGRIMMNWIIYIF